jgi:hypothetical protein
MLSRLPIFGEMQCLVCLFVQGVGMQGFCVVRVSDRSWLLGRPCGDCFNFDSVGLFELVNLGIAEGDLLGLGIGAQVRAWAAEFFVEAEKPFDPDFNWGDVVVAEACDVLPKEGCGFYVEKKQDGHWLFGRGIDGHLVWFEVELTDLFKLGVSALSLEGVVVNTTYRVFADAIVLEAWGDAGAVE